MRKIHSNPQELIRSLPNDLKELLFKQWGAKQNPKWHPEGNTLKHILVVLRRAYKHYPEDPNMIIAALFHDLGKLDTYAINPKTDQPTAYGHEDKSEEYVEEYKEWIEGFDGADVEEIKYLVKNHMRIKPETWGQMKAKKKKPIEINPAFGKLRDFRDKLDGGGIDENLRENIKKILHEAILMERLTEVNNDVNMLYDEYFRKDVEEIERTGIITEGMFKKAITDTSILKDDISVKANEINPCKIKINYGNNYYNPSVDEIGMSINYGTKDYAISRGNGSIKKAIYYLSYNEGKSFLNEFTEHKIKGSIHHELAHWIDDTMNKRHILNRTIKGMKYNTMDIGGVPVNSTKMEIQGQIHNIVQLKNKFKEIWDELTWDELIELSPPLNSINKNLSYKSSDIHRKWIKDLKQRMYREGLLGKKMYKK